ncbi:MAG: biopolymer transporter ExbD [Bacteroidota bacterium]|nr:biopolymer transporter ExbD [Bacteroidota bacterium]
MGKFKRKNEGDSPKISTASLPDIVFMLLFFFMVATVLREVELKVTNELPKATEVSKLQRKSLVSHIYVGAGKYGKWKGENNCLQLNDAIAEIKDIPAFVLAERAARHEDERKLIWTSLKADNKTEMYFIDQVTTELRRVSPMGHKISYTTKKETKK